MEDHDIGVMHQCIFERKLPTLRCRQEQALDRDGMLMDVGCHSKAYESSQSQGIWHRIQSLRKLAWGDVSSKKWFWTTLVSTYRKYQLQEISWSSHWGGLRLMWSFLRFCVFMVQSFIQWTQLLVICLQFWQDYSVHPWKTNKQPEHHHFFGKSNF